MLLYTFIADYKGGTYISQHNAYSPIDALIFWAENLPTKHIKGLGQKSKQKVIDTTMYPEDWEMPIEIEDNKGVYLAHICEFNIHIIETLNNNNL